MFDDFRKYLCTIVAGSTMFAYTGCPSTPKNDYNSKPVIQQNDSSNSGQARAPPTEDLDKIVAEAISEFESKIRPDENRNYHGQSDFFIKILKPYACLLRNNSFLQYSEREQKVVSEIFNDYAWAIKDKGQYEEAITFYTESLRVRKDWGTYLNRAVAYLEMKEFNKALEDINSAQQLKPGVGKKLQKKVEDEMVFLSK